jgi:hypothetical protein
VDLYLCFRREEEECETAKGFVTDMGYKMNTFNVRCCGQAPSWVENVPGKGYLYCRECKNEVIEPLKVEDVVIKPKYDPFTHKVMDNNPYCAHLNIHFTMSPTGQIDPICSDCGSAP